MSHVSIYDLEVKTLQGSVVKLSEYKDRVLLIVNVASKCGFTPQYEALEALYQSYKDKGLVILGFPCDQFGAQESGSEQEIEAFCRLNFGVTFPMFSKIEVNGANEHPLYSYLKKRRSGILGTSAIKWNFTKFLVDTHGDVVERFAPMTRPEALKKHIEALLKEV